MDLLVRQLFWHKATVLTFCRMLVAIALTTREYDKSYILRADMNQYKSKEVAFCPYLRAGNLAPSVLLNKMKTKHLVA